ncbi:hypothetical protein [Streptacidiphilus cavernicola]|uniref:ATP-binding protein n=1 Tax=Streptacidiphilus cavernicola TaxID=3342716 RepID=A0ABV6VTE7_9ACTN
MKKAMRQVAGTAVLGVALAAAAVTPAAAADGAGDMLSSLPTGGLPTVTGLPTGSVQDLATGPVSDGRQVLSSPNGSVHAVSGTAQSLVDTAAPSLHSIEGATGAAGANRALPVSLPGGLPVVGSVPAVSSLPGVGQASGATSGGLGTLTSSLPVHTPLGG